MRKVYGAVAERAHKVSLYASVTKCIFVIKHTLPQSFWLHFLIALLQFDSFSLRFLTLIALFCVCFASFDWVNPFKKDIHQRCILVTLLRADSWFDIINPQFTSRSPSSHTALTLHSTFPAFPLRSQHSTGPSCMEASLSASRRCHHNLISHRRVWLPSMRIYVVFTQRKSNVVIKTHTYTQLTAETMTTLRLEIQKASGEMLQPGCHFVWIIPFIWLCTFKSWSFWSKQCQIVRRCGCVLVADVLYRMLQRSNNSEFKFTGETEKLSFSVSTEDLFWRSVKLPGSHLFFAFSRYISVRSRSLQFGSEKYGKVKIKTEAEFKITYVPHINDSKWSFEERKGFASC